MTLRPTRLITLSVQLHLPVKNYVGQVRVKDLGDGTCQLSWQAVFKSTNVSQEEADKMVQGFLNSIADKIAQK